MEVDVRNLGVVEPGSVLAVKGDFDPSLADAIAGRIGHHDFIVVFAYELDDLHLLDKEAMREHGWVRREATPE